MIHYAAYLIGSAGVALAGAVLLGALASSHPTTWPSLRWTVALFILAAWSLGLGAGHFWGVDFLRPVVCLWAILSGCHHLHNRGGYV